MNMNQETTFRLADPLPELQNAYPNGSIFAARTNIANDVHNSWQDLEHPRIGEVSRDPEKFRARHITMMALGSTTYYSD